MASASDIVFDALRQAIIKGELADGEPLRQDEIASLFNTSRIPVREALSRLEQQGLVRTERYKGAFVAGISTDEVAEIFNFRSLVESTVIAAAVMKIKPGTLAEARDYYEIFSKTQDPMEWGELNRKFHYTLYKDSELPFHLSIINNTLDRVDRYLRAQLTMTDGVPKANKEHLGILQACEDGSAERAADLTQEHILGAKDVLIEFLEKHRRPA
ncbi:MAG: GntR family transcriptional regulator [Sneathiella sp.]|nr:MAG: GntR family transcriptional regulator [Sneathiella sp.]